MKTKSLLAVTLVPYLAFASLAETSPRSNEDSLEQELFLADGYTATSQNYSMTSAPQTMDQNYPGMNRSNEVYSAKPFPKSGCSHLDVTGEFLYLSSEVNGLYYAAVTKNTSVVTSKFYFFEREYSPAFRIAADYSFGAQGWTVGLDWMQFNSSQTQTLHHPYSDGFEGILVYSDINNSYYSEFNTTGGFLSGHQHLSFNEANLNLSKEFFVSKYFTLAPTASGTYIWFNHRLKTEQGNDITGAYNRVVFKNHYQGFGFKFGGSGRLLFGEGIYVLGSADAGITYGPSSNHKVASTSHASPNAEGQGLPAFGSDLKLKPSIFLPFLDAKMDFGWRRSFRDDSVALDLFVGYEYHLFINAVTTLQRAALRDSTDALVQTAKNLGIQGMNLGIKFSF